MEIWDLFDKNRNLIGKTAERCSKLEKDTYHLVVDLFFLNSKRFF